MLHSIVRNGAKSAITRIAGYVEAECAPACQATVCFLPLSARPRHCLYLCTVVSIRAPLRYSIFFFLDQRGPTVRETGEGRQFIVIETDDKIPRGYQSSG